MKESNVPQVLRSPSLLDGFLAASYLSDSVDLKEALDSSWGQHFIRTQLEHGLRATQGSLPCCGGLPACQLLLLVPTLLLS